jgi:hypothetical protein
MPLRKSPNLAIGFAFLLPALFAPRAHSQITEFRGDFPSGDWYTCDLSGLHGMGKDCGTKYDAMVFTAQIMTITPAPDGEFRLTLNPETVFKGAPTVGMEIVTAQWRCLPEMKIGDSWLFSLYRDSKSQELIVNYGSRSGPEAEESAQIELLHKLAAFDHSGIAKGRAHFNRESEDGGEEEVPSINHEIVALRVADNREFKAFTDKDGDFTFGALEAGKYELKPNNKTGLWTMWSGEFDIEAHSCTEFDLDFQTDGEIEGRLVFPVGIDPDSWEVEASPVNDPGIVPASGWTDATGKFDLHGLEPGNYLVFFEKTEKREGPNLKSDLYVPGTLLRSNAQVIELGEAERVRDIELVVPRSALEEH